MAMRKLIYVEKNNELNQSVQKYSHFILHPFKWNCGDTLYGDNEG